MTYGMRYSNINNLARDMVPERSPDPPEPEALYFCASCGNAITEGQVMASNGAVCLCEECLGDLGIEDILDHFGIWMGKANKEDAIMANYESGR